MYRVYSCYLTYLASNTSSQQQYPHTFSGQNTLYVDSIQFMRDLLIFYTVYKYKVRGVLSIHIILKIDKTANSKTPNSKAKSNRRILNREIPKRRILTRNQTNRILIYSPVTLLLNICQSSHLIA